MVKKMIAPKPAAIAGAMAQEAAIWPTLPFFQPQLTCMLQAMPTPTSAPTIDWVVLTGKPKRVQTVSHVADPVQRDVLDLPWLWGPP